MKRYEANQELENFLLRHGFIEIISKRFKNGRKKCFKKTKANRKGIIFNNKDIQIAHKNRIYANYIELNEQQLKYLLFLFELNSRDFKVVCSNEEYSLKEVEKGIISLNKRMNGYIQTGVKKSTVKKYQRILNIYAEIKID